MIEIPNCARARTVDLDSGAFYEQLTAAARVLMSKQQIYEFQETRALFECAIVRYAARHATSKQLAKLRAAPLEDEQSQDDPPRFIETDMASRVLTEGDSEEFHLHLDAGRDRHLVCRTAHRHFAPETPPDPGQELLGAIRESYAGQEAIVRAVESDPDLAESAERSFDARV